MTTHNTSITSGDTFVVLGDLVTIKATGQETGGTLTAVEVVTQPGGGPPPHTHVFAELFLVLEGRLDLLVDGVRKTLRAGELSAVPGGVAHTYSNGSNAPARFLAVLHPAGHEHFFAELGVPAGTPAPEGPPDIERVLEIAHRYGIRFVGQHEQEASV